MYLDEAIIISKDSYRFGYHGATNLTVVDHQFSGTEVFLAHDKSLAEAFAEDHGEVFLVEQLGVKPLLLDTPEHKGKVE